REGGTRRFKPMMTNLPYRGWREDMKPLDGLGAWSTEQVALAGQAHAARIKIADVTPSLLPMLQAAPALGRLFTDADTPESDAATRRHEGRAGVPVVILSSGLWQQQFGGPRDVLGQTIRLDATSYTVVGVMPASFGFPDRDTRAWVPFYVEPVTTPGSQNFSISMFQALGRLRPGVTPAQAAAEGTARGRTVPDPGVVAMAVFGSNGPVTVTVTPMLDALTKDVRPAILILFAAGALLLAAATANVASLQLARATGRRRELAIRSALGAARGRLARQTLVENVLLGMLGGAAGLGLAALMHRALPSILPAGFPRLDDLAFDWRIQAFAAGVSIAAGLGCGLLPALQVAKTDLVPALAEDATAPAGGGLRTRTERTRAAIMAAQVAIACMLLVGASLLVRSFVHLMKADLGYDAANLLTARLVMADGEFSPERRLAILDTITARLSATQGVTRVAFTNSLPFSGGEALSSFPVTRRDGGAVQVQTGQRQVSAGYFAAMGQRVVEGREFTAEDGSAVNPSVVVNREFARKYLDGRALGWWLPGRLKPGSTGNVRRPIVGVVEDAVRHDVTDAPQPEVYFTPSHQADATSQQRVGSSDLDLIVRSTSDPRAVVPALREIVEREAPTVPLESVMTMKDRVAESLAQPRLYAVLLATFAVFALAIAGVGLFGVLSYSVAQRSREIGVRAAPGAQVAALVGLVLRPALALATAGVAAGLAASFWLARGLEKVLYGVTPHDAASFALVAAVLLAVAAIASIVPARRAARVDPVNVLRS